MSRPLTTEEAAAIERAKGYVALAKEVHTPPKGHATAQPPPESVAKLSSGARILDQFAVAVRGCGVVGERATAQLVYLVITSRLLDKPVSLGVKGHSSSGKSFVVEMTARFFPRVAVLPMTAMSQRALVYSPENYQHRTLILYELTALREGVEDDLTAYFVRSLLSEGRIEYPVTIRTKDEGFVTKTIIKEGPTGLVFTTTKDRIHAENETRVLSVTSDDSRRQTARVLEALARGPDEDVDLAPWLALQGWLQNAEHRVVIPYSMDLAKLVPPVAVRLRRDFGAVLGLVKASAILNQLSRERDIDGRIIASFDDYAVVRELVAPVVSEGVGGTVSKATRETVEAVAGLAATEGVQATAIAKRLGLDKSAASRRLTVASRDGWVLNQEDRRGKPGKWVIGEPLPGEVEILPAVERLQAVAEGIATPEDPDSNSDQPTGCTVAEVDGDICMPSENGVHAPQEEVATAQPRLLDDPRPLPYAPRDPLRPHLMRASQTAPDEGWRTGANIPKFWPDGTPYSLDRPLEEHDQYALDGDGVLPL